MSFIEIIDGNGGGKRASVNRYNELLVQAESIPSEASQAERGNSFIIHAECHLSASTSGGLMTFTNNDVNNDIEITRIYIDTHVITPVDLIITQVFDATISNGTDVSSTAVVQKNRGKSNLLDSTVTISDASSDMTYTGGTQYHAFPVKSMTGVQRNMNGTNIIPAGKSITFGFKSAGGATDGEIISLSVNTIKRLKTDEF